MSQGSTTVTGNSRLSPKRASSPPQSPRSPLPWKGDLKGFQFLRIDPIVRLKDIGATAKRMVAGDDTLVFTTNTSAIMYDTTRKTVRECLYDSEVSTYHSMAHSLSPDKVILLRWKEHGRNSAKQWRFPFFCSPKADPVSKQGTHWTVEAIHTTIHTPLARLKGHHWTSHVDAAKVFWLGNDVVFIPDSTRGVVIRWALLEKNKDPVSIIRPLPSISRHNNILFYMSKEEKLWIARGRTRTNSGSDSGLIQIHDVERGESKVITGLAFSVTEAEVYDKKRRLLLSCNANEETLSVEIQQLDDIGQGDHFGKVSVNLPILEKDDAPAIIRVLEGLPVVAVVTCKDIIYFFELHSGAFLYSQDFRPDTIWGAKDDEQSILLTSRDWNVANRISVNREDLIGYVRQVLGDDTLASSIAVRTGLPGAEDVLLNDMHGDYQRFMVQSVNEG